MAEYTVQDQATGKIITFQWNDPNPPTDADMSQVFAEAEKFTPPTPVKEEPGFLSRVGADIKKRAGNIASEWTGNPDESLVDSFAKSGQRYFNTAGQVAGGVGDIVGEGTKGLYTSLVPDRAQEAIKSGLYSALNTPAGRGIADAAQKGTELYGSFKEAMPEAAKFTESAANIASLLPISKGGRIAGEVAGVAAERTVKPVARLANQAAKETIGMTTGTGRGAVDEALKGSAAFQKAMRGEITGDEVVQHARDMLQTVVDNRGTTYREQLKNLKGSGQIIDRAPIDNTLNKIMADHNISIKIDTKGNSVIDTSQAGMGKAGRNDIQGVIEEVQGWTDNTPEGLDRLRKRLDDFYSDSSQARAAVTRLRNSVNDTIKKAVPEYTEMTRGYAEATALVKDIEKNLMLKKGNTADQTLRRLTSSLRENFELRKDLVDALGNASGQDLSAEIAGYAMSSAIPRGLIGKLTGGGAGYLAYMNPKMWPLLAASSPRVAGEFLNAFGKARNKIKKVIP